MNKEFSHRFSEEVLFASFNFCRVRARPCGLVRKFSRRTHKQVIVIAFFVFLCSLLQIGL